MEDDTIDYDGLLQANLKRIFSEPDAERRKTAIAEIYAADAVLYEPGHIATGHAEITRTIDALLTSFPPDFAFAADGPAVGHHGLARLRWRAGPADGPAAVTGTDVVQVEQGRIKTIHVFLDPTPA
ncbi:nuclear transport factor 2 family protein [Brevundimonas sp.]|jgi:hypothetical protein|uniref:nuclear transport factor 2 family protein n=1 Tax=Brevundimonas sp. TaxID=1871086 RepID=UPI0037BE4AF0